MFLFVADEVLIDGTQQHSTGRGVCYFKLMNKTSWQELIWQISGALVAALCQDSVLKLVHDKNNSCMIFTIFTSPKPGGDQRSMGIDHVCVRVCACVCLECQFFTITTYLYYIHN